MSKPIRRGSKWITNLDMPCSGVECHTPEKPLPHTHRKRLSFDTKEAHDLKISEMKAARKQLRHGVAIGEMSWPAFKAKFMIYSKGKNQQTHYRDTLAIRYLEKFYPISQLKQITPELLEGLKQKLLDNGKKAWNINRVLSALKAMMRFAQASKLIEPQHWDLARRIKTPKGRLHFWRTEEIKALYERCSGIWLTMAMLAVEAGLRREEIRTVKRENIDFERNRIHIVGDENWSPKDYERRWVPMKPTLRKHLSKIKMGNFYVLSDRPTLGSMTSYFRRLVAEAKLKGSLVTGRHSYGSHLAMQGIPLAVIQQRMGHESIETTQIYAHLCPEITQEMYAA